MTKKEFETTEEPLVIIVSLNPSTGKVIYDTYDYNTADQWMEDFKKDFPKMLHFRETNPAGIKERMKRCGFKKIS